MRANSYFFVFVCFFIQPSLIAEELQRVAPRVNLDELLPLSGGRYSDRGLLEGLLPEGTDLTAAMAANPRQELERVYRQRALDAVARVTEASRREDPSVPAGYTGPTNATERENINSLIRQLDSSHFATRLGAETQLVQLGYRAIPQLEKAVAPNPNDNREWSGRRASVLAAHNARVEEYRRTVAAASDELIANAAMALSLRFSQVLSATRMLELLGEGRETRNLLPVVRQADRNPDNSIEALIIRAFADSFATSFRRYARPHAGNPEAYQSALGRILDLSDSRISLLHAIDQIELVIPEDIRRTLQRTDTSGEARPRRERSRPSTKPRGSWNPSPTTVKLTDICLVPHA